ncbi:MAG: glycosyltransferase [Bacteroidaceae bacterium]|nr:glycosyltransferase [Bacteroidaceae bacterium]
MQLIQRTKNQEELARLYSAADVFLMTSLMENFPTTCIESLCCGTPVVGIKNTGGTEETAPAPYGIFVERETDTILKALEEMLISKPSKDKISSWAREEYSNETMAVKYLDLYQQIMECKQA